VLALHVLHDFNNFVVFYAKNSTNRDKYYFQFFISSTGRAPAHRARDTVTPNIISLTLWTRSITPSWSVLQERVYRSRIADTDELKTRLIDEWD